jgi:hypothetical protein
MHVAYTFQEISNAADVRHILEKGVTHKSPFAERVFDFIFSDVDTLGTNHPYNRDDYKEHFWQSRFATLSVQLVNQEQNNYASFIRASIDLSLPPRKPDLELIQILNNLRHSDSTPGLDEDDSVDSNVAIPDEISSVDPYLDMASQLYSSAFFGRQDLDAWLQRFLPIVATITTYRNGTSTPISKKNSTKYWEAVNKIVAIELVGKTVSQVIETVEESLIRLIVIKHLISSTIFKDHLDILVLLLKSRSSLGAAPSDSTVDQPAVNNAVRTAVVSSDYVPSITLPPVSKYTTADLKFFIKLRNQIKTTERLDDKKCVNSNDDSNDGDETNANNHPFVLSYVLPELPHAGSSPSVGANKSKRRKVTSPSGANLKLVSGAMEVFCDSDDED